MMLDKSPAFRDDPPFRRATADSSTEMNRYSAPDGIT
jgi:hypothetical protein